MKIKFQENFIVLVTYLEHEASFAWSYDFEAISL